MGFKDFLKDHFRRESSVVDTLDDEREETEEEEEAEKVFEQQEKKERETIKAPEYVSFERRKTEQDKRNVNDSSAAGRAFGKIHSMNDASVKRTEAPKCKIASVKLRTFHDVGMVADLFKNNNTFIIVNYEKLSTDQAVRASCFLDGARHVTGIVMKKYTENIFLYFPASIEISGDFYEQVDVSGFTFTK